VAPGARILPEEDREMARRVSSGLEEQGMRILGGTKPLAVEEVKGGTSLRAQTMGGGKSLEASFVLQPRRGPAVGGLALERGGLCAEKECLKMDPFLR